MSLHWTPQGIVTLNAREKKALRVGLVKESFGPWNCPNGVGERTLQDLAWRGLLSECAAGLRYQHTEYSLTDAGRAAIVAVDGQPEGAGQT